MSPPEALFQSQQVTLRAALLSPSRAVFKAGDGYLNSVRLVEVDINLVPSSRDELIAESPDTIHQGADFFMGLGNQHLPGPKIIDCKCEFACEVAHRTPELLMGFAS